jgi:hypothetical protein
MEIEILVGQVTKLEERSQIQKYVKFAEKTFLLHTYNSSSFKSTSDRVYGIIEKLLIHGKDYNSKCLKNIYEKLTSIQSQNTINIVHFLLQLSKEPLKAKYQRPYQPEVSTATNDQFSGDHWEVFKVVDNQSSDDESNESSLTYDLILPRPKRSPPKTRTPSRPQQWTMNKFWLEPERVYPIEKLNLKTAHTLSKLLLTRYRHQIYIRTKIPPITVCR